MQLIPIALLFNQFIGSAEYGVLNHKKISEIGRFARSLSTVQADVIQLILIATVALANLSVH